MMNGKIRIKITSTGVNHLSSNMSHDNECTYNFSVLLKKFFTNIKNSKRYTVINGKSSKWR